MFCKHLHFQKRVARASRILISNRPEIAYLHFAKETLESKIETL